MGKSVILDSNLLVLLVVGTTDRRLIDRHKNLSAYDADAFDLLVEKLGEYSKIILTPNTLTETSNILRQIGDPHRSQLTLALRALILKHNERFVLSEGASAEPAYPRLGLTDAALMIAAREEGELLSADNDLYLAALQQGINALNFAHLYEARFGFE